MQSGRMAEAAGAADPDPMNRVWTIPNALSVARLLGVPVFLWLVLGPRSATADGWAVGILIAAGASDWLDGKIARALNQTSRLGAAARPRGRPALHHRDADRPGRPRRSSRGGWWPCWSPASW